MTEGQILILAVKRKDTDAYYFILEAYRDGTMSLNEVQSYYRKTYPELKIEYDYADQITKSIFCKRVYTLDEFNNL